MPGHVDILIVGGGAAGIAAARRLAGGRHSVLLLEAGDRLGGRAFTTSLAGMKLDLGCGWLHSADRNPWARLAEAEGWPIDRTPPAWREQWQEIGFSGTEQRDALAAFEAFDKRLREEAPPSDRAADALEPGCRWNAWLEALSGYINGAELGCLSIADYLAYEDADSDVNWRLPDGYGALVAAAGTDLPVRLAAPVTTIDRRTTPLRATGPWGSVTADRVIVAVPTNVLAEERLRFDPPLPDKVEAAADLPLGLANKAFLLLDRPEPFERDTQLLGDPHDPATGSYYLRPFGRPLIECFFGGAGARSLETEGEGAAADFAIQQLVGLLGSDTRRRLTPLAETRWGADPLLGGSYSHALPGKADARARLAASVENRIFFAGEACSASDFSTAHGAYATGVEAAEAAIASLS
ncbi:FAD-dependent oxidoreductase [Sphingosinicella sp. YJ22]|uniref:flavin monoamine oxidase family protein n=1 Tax=Sphingosinicella sp. YJ22 TaxID=1104780 RepID=UPI00140B36B6|nr:FAD-dependent oxidoreductase [Sphingosinicella sp. YJ22]